jgi:hypothetical protein
MAAFDVSKLVVLRAPQAEVGEHDKVLEAIDRESRGGTVLENADETGLRSHFFGEEITCFV